MGKHTILIVAGSETDLAVLDETRKTLDWFGVNCELVVASAHRDPERVRRLASGARKNGTSVIIAGAGMASHLAGVIASHTCLPVIGVPLPSEPFGALDSLLSTVQMPRGVPVATVSAGRAGAVNAAILAVEMLAIGSTRLARRLEEHRRMLRPK
ncbi:MAG: 5-(carboxyamino)imidazole ribonucleotide mutase [Candidatus Eisenbacteria bacterium]